jgi:hypothetical protein
MLRYINLITTAAELYTTKQESLLEICVLTLGFTLKNEAIQQTRIITGNLCLDNDKIIEHGYAWSKVNLTDSIS